MSAPLGDLGVEEFLDSYWQKKPCLIRQAFPSFKPELDVNDVAGLACEELAEARLVSGSFPEHDWQLRYGPFSEQDLATLPDRNWTLLVQDVEKHYPPLKSLLAAFDFLPAWRIDDLMTSVAAPGGSVGPHTDQYDVFLLQAAGTRRWQIAGVFDSALLPDCELNVLKSFEPEQEWLLEAGDMLYLPPGIAHHGVAVERQQDESCIETCMTWSVGLRAPSTADLLQAMGEWLAQNREEGPRYGDPGLSPPDRGGEIDAAAIERFRAMLIGQAGDDAAFRTFLGSFVSRYRLAHEPAAPENAVLPADLLAALDRGANIRSNPWTRLAWLESDGGAMLFAAGDDFRCPPGFAQQLCSASGPQFDRGSLCDEEIELLCELHNRGHLYLEFSGKETRAR